MQPAADSVVFATEDRGFSWFSPGGLDGAFECLCLLRASDGAIYAGTTPNGDVFKYLPLPPSHVQESAENFFDSYELAQNYPNPFNSSTIIPISIPQDCRVRIKVYDVSGHLVKIVCDKYMTVGCHDVLFTNAGRNDLGLASGVYVYSLETENFKTSKKFLCLK